ncbi:MAG: helix-turn-helix domain-containing protein, partial [bacterium]
MRDKHLERRDPDGRDPVRRDPVRRDPDPTGGRGMAAALLRRARQDAGLTQTRLAELADTAQSAIAAYEAGVREPNLPVLTRMLAASGMRHELDVAQDESVYRLFDHSRYCA